MTHALYRLGLPNETVRLASGTTEGGPNALLPAGLTLATLLAEGQEAINAAARSGDTPVPDGSAILAPVDDQEVWAAGVTYQRSRDARVDESQGAGSVYDRVYEAVRPELFFKAPGWRVRGPGSEIGIRADSAWNVPEPELAVVLAADLSLAGYTIGNDVSSRSIEGENPLYLPQAKVYDGACALGPAIVPAGLVRGPFAVRLTIVRDGAPVVTGETTTARMRRPPAELAEALGRALAFPTGAILLTGTGIVPPASFTLHAGDRVRIEIDGLGALENVVAVVGARA